MTVEYKRTCTPCSNGLFVPDAEKDKEKSHAMSVETEYVSYALDDAGIAKKYYADLVDLLIVVQRPDDLIHGNR